MTPTQQQSLVNIRKALVRATEAIDAMIEPPTVKVSTKKPGTNSLTLATKYSAQDMDDAKYLQTLILTNYPYLKPTKEINLWADEIRKIREIDGFKREIIVGVIEWAQNDSFWRKNIRSASKLRKQFETLLTNAQAEAEARNSKSLV